MTLLKKPVTRELPIEFDRRSWKAIMHGWGVELRPKRSRKESYTIRWETIIDRAIQIEVARRREERKTKRGSRG